MAMSYHQEARIKQDRIDRWNSQKLRADLEPPNQGIGNRLEEAAYKKQMDKVLITDPGQFNQIRSPPKPEAGGKQVRYQTGVVFNKVVHDPNFNFRLDQAMGGNSLHVNPIYKIMYPNSFHYRNK